MFRKHQMLGPHSRPQRQGRDKPAMLDQIRMQYAKPKTPKVKKKPYSTVRHNQKLYKPLGTFIEIMLRLRGVVHVICTQNAVTINERKNTNYSPCNRSYNSYKFR